jgi:hypothetical protein
MGEATAELNGRVESTEPEIIEREVEEIRDNITGIVGELDRRGHELVDWRSHLQKHALLLAALGAGCLVGLGVTIAGRRARQKRRNRPLEKARRLRVAISRMIAHPERVAQPRPGIGHKALGAAVGATAGFLVKALLKEMVVTAEPAGAASS